MALLGVHAQPRLGQLLTTLQCRSRLATIADPAAQQLLVCQRSQGQGAAAGPLEADAADAADLEHSAAALFQGQDSGLRDGVTA